MAAKALAATLKDSPAPLGAQDLPVLQHSIATAQPTERSAASVTRAASSGDGSRGFGRSPLMAFGARPI